MLALLLSTLLLPHPMPPRVDSVHRRPPRWEHVVRWGKVICSIADKYFCKDAIDIIRRDPIYSR